MQRRTCGREQEFGFRVIPGSIYRQKPPENYDQSKDDNPVWLWQCHFSRLITKTIIDAYPKSFFRFSQSAAFDNPEYQADFPRLWMENGSLIYLDNNHLEAANAETALDSFGAVIQEKANERILYQALPTTGSIPGLKRVALLKNNTGFSRDKYGQSLVGVSYGSHQNYSYSSSARKVVSELLVNFIPTHLPFSGSGCIAGDGQYLLSGRAEYIVCDQSVNTVENRGIIHSIERDGFSKGSSLERLHIISRDATRCEFQTWLVDMMTHFVIRLAEEGWTLPENLLLLSPTQNFSYLNRHFLSDLDPRVSCQSISGPVSISLEEYQLIFLSAAKQLSPLSEMERRGLEVWEWVFDLLRRREYRKLVGKLDWATKQHFLNMAMEKWHFDLKDPRAQLIDFGYHDISPSPRESCFAFLDELGYIDHLVSEEEIRLAMTVPPATRAQSRSEFIKKCYELPQLGERVQSLDWCEVSIAGYQNQWCYFGELNDPLSASSSTLEDLYKKLPEVLKS